LQISIAVKPIENFQIIKITVKIIDINDNVPTFVLGLGDPRFLVAISEMARPGESFPLPLARDPDHGMFGIQRYSLRSENDDGVFEIVAQRDETVITDLRLRLKKGVDRELKQRYELEVHSEDGGSPANVGILLVSDLFQFYIDSVFSLA